MIWFENADGAGKGKKSGGLIYAAGACMALVLIIMGVSMFNSADRMRSVQTTLETLADANRTEDIPDGADAPDAPDTAGESDEADAPDAGDAQDAADASDTSDGLSASTEPETQAASAPVTAVTPGKRRMTGSRLERMTG